MFLRLATWQRYALMFLAGCLYPMGFAPFDLWPLTLASLAIGYFLLQLHNQDAPPTANHTTKNLTSKLSSSHNTDTSHRFRFKRIFFSSFWYCMGVFGVGIAWVHISIHVYGESPLWISLLLTLALVAVMSAFMALIMACERGHTSPVASALSFAGLWVGGELLRSFAFTGFPWLLLGYAFIDTPLSGFAPVVGVYGLSLIAALIAGLAIAGLTYRLNWRGISCVLGISLLFGSGWLLQQKQWTHPLAPAIDVTLVQGNIDQRIKWDESEQEHTLRVYRQMTDVWRLSPPSTPPSNTAATRLVVWPEAAIPLFYHEAEAYIDDLSQTLKQQNISWITGVPYEDDTEGTAKYFNSVISKGLGHGRYNKQKLVPFGEFIPFPDLIRLLGQLLQIPFFDLPMSSFSKGDTDQPPLIANQQRIAPFICYEIVYPDLVRHNAAHSDLLLTISNDAWFGDSIAPHQHFQIARMRALETGQMLIRSTNTGISGLVDHHGQVLMQLPSFQQTFGSGQVFATKGQTPFMRWGNLPLYAVILGFFLWSSAPLSKARLKFLHHGLFCRSRKT